MTAYMPPGWPTGVHPPGSEDFEASAVGCLTSFRLATGRMMCCAAIRSPWPPWRGTTWRPACTAPRQGYRSARTELGEVLPPHALQQVLAAYNIEGSGMAATERAVDLLLRALRGEVFRPQMGENLPHRQAPPGPV